MKLAVVTQNYPSANRQMEGGFVRQFVLALSRAGVECVVIAPLSVVAPRNWPLAPREALEQAGGPAVRVLRPRYVSFSARQMPGFNTAMLTLRSFTACVRRTLQRIDWSPDLVYGHFLYCAGHAAVHLGSRINRPSVVSVGEGEFWSVQPFGFDKAVQDFRPAGGFLAVSSVVRDGLVRELAIPSDKTRVFPNGVDLSQFIPGNRTEARTRFGIAEELFVIAFVGHFYEQKGLKRLLEAVRGLSGVALLLVGHGPVKVADSDPVAFKGTLPHEEVSVALSAADAFVLPTEVEGSCNSVLEAMACGLPIISSNGRYMDDILDDDVAIRVDPMDVRAIRDAIVTLMNDPARRRRMSEACLRKSRQFDINLRARAVTNWLEDIVGSSRARMAGITPALGAHCSSSSAPETNSRSNRSSGVSTKKLRVCVVTTRHAAKDDRIYYKEVLSLAKRYDTVTLIAPSEKAQEFGFHPHVRYVPLQERQGLVGRALMVREAVQQLRRQRTDICHFHDFDLAAVLPFVRVLIGAELVYDVHEFYPMAAVLLGLPRLARSALQRSVAIFEELAARRCSMVIAVVDPLTARFREAGCNAVTIFNYVRQGEIGFNRQRQRELLRRYQDRKIILYQGSLSQERGMFQMIGAMRTLKRHDPRIMLLLVGELREPLLSQVNEQRTEFDLTGCIDHVPWVSHTSVFDYISVARIGLIPFLPVGQYPQVLPIKLFEYMVCGIPVLSADLPAIRPYVEESKAGLLYDSTSSEALAERVIQMLSDEEGLRQMGENGRRAVREKWNWGRMEERLLKAYCDIEGRFRRGQGIVAPRECEVTGLQRTLRSQMSQPGACDPARTQDTRGI
ncbi:MAG: glycosyltransferase [candidate division WOR-3 bacterium]|nr:MAG: glycosyltransferase [candidate division WOR-3 bacterium]